MGDIQGQEPGRDGLIYLSNEDVLRCLDDVDALDVIHRALVQHAHGNTVLPAEASLYWQTATGATARSLALPGLVDGVPRAAGIKVINASSDNVGLGLPRASGLVTIFSPDTGRVLAVMQAEHVSSRRTAAVTALAIRRFAPHATSLALVGSGALARAHVALCPAAMPDLCQILLFDILPERAELLATELQAARQTRPIDVQVVGAAEQAVRAGRVVVALTTTTTPYIQHSWLDSTDLVVNVSLDDCTEDVFQRCGLLVVDDWDLVASDRRRLLGRLAARGAIGGPTSSTGEAPAPKSGPGPRRVDGELAGYLAASETELAVAGPVVVNPFGMGIHDVALGAAVLAVATRHNRGQWLPA